MSRDNFEYALTRGDARLFADVDVVNQSAKTDANGDPVRDSHGNIEWASKSTTTVPGEITYRGTPGFQRRADGLDTDIDCLVWVSDDAVTFTDGSDDETTRATRVDADGETYRVVDVFDERNGRRRAHCEKE